MVKEDEENYLFDSIKIPVELRMRDRFRTVWKGSLEVSKPQGQIWINELIR